MSAGLERRYRRVLRLLPAGYRQAWEEDMVSAFMQSADSASTARPSLAERASVVVLAMRLRLAGSHTSPRGLVWYQALHAFALVALLYQALAATVELARIGGRILWSPVAYRDDIVGNVITWVAPASSLLWIVTFACFALDRWAAARVLALPAAVATIGITVALSIEYPGYGAQMAALTIDNLSRWGWLAASVLVVLLAPVGHTSMRGGRDGRRSSVAWLGAYLVGALALAPGGAVSVGPRHAQWPYLHWNLSIATHLGLLAGMIVVLVRVARRRTDPHWLLVLAGFAGGQAGVRLLGRLTVSVSGEGLIPHITVYLRPSVDIWPAIQLLLMALAATCAVAGALALRRLPRASNGPPPKRA